MGSNWEELVEDVGDCAAEEEGDSGTIVDRSGMVLRLDDACGGPAREWSSTPGFEGPPRLVMMRRGCKYYSDKCGDRRQETIETFYTETEYIAKGVVNLVYSS